MERAEAGQLRYANRMRRSITASPEIVRHIEGLTEANFNLLTKLIEWLANNEKRREKHRFAVVHRLARIEAIISLLLVGQQAQTLSKPPWCPPEKLEEEARRDEEWIDSQSEQIGMKMIRYIYSKDPTSEPRRDRRRKWSGWEI